MRTEYLRAWRRTGPNSAAAVAARKLYRACVRRSKRAGRPGGHGRPARAAAAGGRCGRSGSVSKAGGCCGRCKAASRAGSRTLPPCSARPCRRPQRSTAGGRVGRPAQQCPQRAVHCSGAAGWLGLRRNKAADLDGLRAELLKCGTGLDQPLLHLCNLHLSIGSLLAKVFSMLLDAHHRLPGGQQLAQHVPGRLPAGQGHL
jgi:hypothetical protein